MKIRSRSPAITGLPLCILVAFVSSSGLAAGATSPQTRETRWAIPYGKEFWRSAAAARGQEAGRDGINLANVIERVTHALTIDPLSGVPESRADAYRVRFEADTVRLLPPATDAWLAPWDAHELRIHIVKSGDNSLYRATTAPVEWRVVGNTAQRLLDARTGLVEHYEARSSGLQLTWVLPDRPSTDGTLSFEIDLRNLATSGQWQLTEPTVVDANGRKWPAATSTATNKWLINVPGNVLREATFPIAVTPLISPDLRVGTPVVSPASGDQYNATLAASGDMYLVAWTHGPFQSTGPSVIRGARVTLSGDVLDPSGIYLFGEYRDLPAVAGNGSDFLVLSKPENVFGEPVSPGTALLGVRVTKAGTVSSVFTLGSDVVDDGTPPAVVARSNDYLVAWSQQHYGPPNQPDGPPTPTVKRIHARLVGDAGPGPTFMIADSGGDQVQPAASTDGAQYFVLACMEGGIYGRRVSPNGQVDPTNIVVSPAALPGASPRVAWAKNNFLVVWEDNRNGSYDVFGARLTADGTLLDPTGFLIAGNDEAQHSPAIASSGTNCLVSWIDTAEDGRPQVQAAIVDPEMSTSTQPIFPTQFNSAGRAPPAAAWNGNAFLLVWSGFDVLGTRISAGGALLGDTFPISTTYNDQVTPAVAFNGNVFLVAWSDSRNALTTGSDIYGTRVSRTGVVLDPAGIPISVSPRSQRFPAIAACGSNFLVVWEEIHPITFADVYGAIITDSGEALTPSIPICASPNTQAVPAVASNGEGYLIVWEDWRNPFPISIDIYAAQVTENGNVQQPQGFPICSVDEAQRYPAIASADGEYLVVWTDSRAPLEDRNIYGARVDSGGVVQDANGFPVNRAASWQQFPRVAASATNYFVVWEDFRSAPLDNVGNGPADIWGSIVDLNRNVAFPNGLLINAAANRQYRPDVAAHETGFVVVWQDSRNPGTNIYATRVSAAAQVLDTNGWRINESAATRTRPGVAYGGNDSFLIVSEAFDPTPPHQNPLETRANLLELDDTPVIHSIRWQGSEVIISWFAKPGQPYQVQYKDRLTDPTWSDLDGDMIANTRTVTITDDTQPMPAARFYRVTQSP